MRRGAWRVPGLSFHRCWSGKRFQTRWVVACRARGAATGDVEDRLLGRSPAFGIEAIGDVLGGGILLKLLGDPRDQPVELLQLLEAPDRADQRVPVITPPAQ